MPESTASETRTSNAPPRRRTPRRLLKGLAILTALLVFIAAALVLWGWASLKGSLPQLDGEVRIAGLAGPVRIERDALGIPTIRGDTPDDVVRAIGFVHAQDRFFQMDLLRRAAAGELAELFGPALVSQDKRVRVHRLRAIAERVVEATDPKGRSRAEAYAAGVNAGLAALGSKPFEYHILRAEPAPWVPADSALVLLAMFLDLTNWSGAHESSHGVLYDVLPPALADFLAPPGTEWDAPIVGAPFEVPPIPGPDVFDLRETASDSAVARGTADGPAPIAGSNNWVVSGTRTADGRALVAGDMHLRLGVPNIWYRVAIHRPAEDGSGEEHRAYGITLPGASVLVSGSNTRVAWAFTNSMGDWADLVVVEVNPDDPDVYLTPDGPQKLERHQETIRVNGGEDEMFEVDWTIWGPVIDRDHHDRPRALRWTAHDLEAVSFGHGRLEEARGLDELMTFGALAGSPPQNMVAADSTGRIGWTILGAIPRRTGFDGRLPTSWADGTRGWDGWLSPEEHPRVIDPEGGGLWSANARVVDGEMLREIGDGGYILGARAGQIRDGVTAMSGATVADMLALQLDDRALFLRRWRDLLLRALTPEALEADPRRRRLREVVEDWGERAAIGSIGYRMVRGFRIHVARQVLGAITAACSEADSRFSIWELRQYQGPLWKLVTERPAHLLNPELASWDEQILAGADALLDDLWSDESGLDGKTWGARNTARIQHPLSRAIPPLGRWLDMPAEPLSGDSHMPLAQRPSYGASQRMVVSPGNESEGMFHMPCGQSGHPLSPHYRDAHAAWSQGTPTPFLPGPPQHTLTLLPTN